jgi:hypothetical protein
MDVWKGYDAWRLDNNEKPCTCDKCEGEVEGDSDLFETTAGSYYCESCVEDYISCKCCGRAIVNSEYDYNNTCDSCVEDEAEKRFQDYKDRKFDRVD